MQASHLPYFSGSPVENKSFHILLGVVRVMALNAFSASLVPPVFDTHQIAASTIGIFEPGMTPETKFSGRIKRQVFFVVGMIDGWTMTVFTFNRLMG
jgi:hypothetical protein